MVEQPVPAGDDDVLRHIARPLPVCADEACHTSADVDGLVGKYDIVNIKLDKTGGLTEALRLLERAKNEGMGDHGRLHGQHVPGHGACFRLERRGGVCRSGWTAIAGGGSRSANRVSWQPDDAAGFKAMGMTRRHGARSVVRLKVPA